MDVGSMRAAGGAVLSADTTLRGNQPPEESVNKVRTVSTLLTPCGEDGQDLAATGGNLGAAAPIEERGRLTCPLVTHCGPWPGPRRYRPRLVVVTFATGSATLSGSP